jgi:hypothetical protein
MKLKPLDVIRFIVIILILLHVNIVNNSSAQDVTDADIKAILFFKFSGYVKWPPEITINNSKTIECCVMGTGHLSQLLLNYDAKQMMNRTVHSTQVSNPDTLTGCHILFVSSSEKKKQSQIFKAISGKPILTVGDFKGFSKNGGGIINFIRKKDTVHFEINPENAKRAGLKISSKLLRLSKIVK